MASTGAALAIISLGEIRVVSATVPGQPLVTAIAGGDSQVVLTVTADAESDTIYVRYRAQATASWCTEAQAFTRTGSGTVTVTGLTNETHYQFGVYAKAENNRSVWDFSTATPTDGSITDTELDEDLPDEIYDIIDEYGMTVTFSVAATKTYDPSLGRMTEGGVSSYDKKVSPPEGYDEKYVDNDLIQQGDVKIYLPEKDLEFNPIAGMKVTIRETIWQIVRVKPIRTGEQIGIYELQLRS